MENWTVSTRKASITFRQLSTAWAKVRRVQQKIEIKQRQGIDTSKLEKIRDIEIESAKRITKKHMEEIAKLLDIQ
jgi:hypothetical protein